MKTLSRTSRLRLGVSLVLAAVLTSACVSSRALTATPRLSTPAPASWTSTAQGADAGQAQDLSRWWEQLGDSLLSSLVTRAVQGSPDLRTAQARLRQARAQRGIQQANLLPAISGSATVSDRNGSSGAVSAGIDASWEPDVFGGTRRGIDAATADVRATAADLYAAQVSLIAEVALSYTQLRTSQTRLDIARRNAASQAETLELTDFRAQAGLVSSLDVERARSNLEQTRAALPLLEANISQTRHRLATLAGLEPAALNGELGAASRLPQVPAQVAVGIPAETLRQRPDVRTAEERIVAETARLAQAKTSRYPRFTLSGSIGTEILTGALTGGASLARSVAGSVVQTLFDGGRIREQIAVQTAVQEQAVSSYDATVLVALEEVENALVSFEKTRQRLESLAAASTAASDAALLARNQYTSGLTDFQTVLDTERTVLSVHDNVASTEGDRLTALVQLYKSLGGGWTPSAIATSGSATTQP
jgi:outer membrane protein, multidrug efflux system